MIMIPSSVVSAAAPDKSATAGNTTEEQPKTVLQPKYGIMTSRATGGYTFYDLNDRSEHNAAIEITEKDHVMVPVAELTQLMNGVNYQYTKSKKTMTVTNTLNGKKIVYTIGKSNLNYYSSAKAKAAKKKISEAAYVSERSDAFMVPADSLKYIMGTTAGFRYYQPAEMQEKGYDTYTYSGLYVYNTMQAITEMPLAPKVYGIPSSVKVTIPEGYSVAQIFDLLVKKGVCTSTAGLYDAMETYDYTVNYPLIKELPENPDRCFKLEGYLYPDTYEFKLLSKPEDAIGKFLRNSKVKITDADRQRAAELGYSINEILTIASMIEKETPDKTTMPVISSVIHNRLNIKMKLQLDCTINYVEWYIKPYITGDENRYNSYYNTYKCSALPAGPICNPSRAAINAALYPSTTDYLYFYSDSQGYHFSKEWVKYPAEEIEE
jgi:uncharacterized YceG family protein